jgi:hypothetical protein
MLENNINHILVKYDEMKKWRWNPSSNMMKWRTRGRSREMTKREDIFNKFNMPGNEYFGSGWVKAVIGTLS